MPNKHHVGKRKRRGRKSSVNRSLVHMHVLDLCLTSFLWHAAYVAKLAIFLHAPRCIAFEQSTRQCIGERENENENENRGLGWVER
jgi:hypothetical protein